MDTTGHTTKRSANPATPEDRWWRIIKVLMENNHDDIAVQAEIIRENFTREPDPEIDKNINADMLYTLTQIAMAAPEQCRIGDGLHLAYRKPGKLNCVWEKKGIYEIWTTIGQKGEITRILILNQETKKLAPAKDLSARKILEILRKEKNVD